MSHRHIPLAAAMLLAIAGTAEAQELRDTDFFSTTSGYVTEHRSVAQTRPHQQFRGSEGDFGSFGAAQVTHTLGY